jgi:hypothetical protein
MGKEQARANAAVEKTLSSFSEKELEGIQRSDIQVKGGAMRLQFCKAEAEADLSEYGRAWAVHQLVPFADKLLGIAGAMDNRMVGQPYDWWLRLPMALLSLALPNECVLLIAHLVNIATWFERMPAVWDYMVWCAIMEVTFVVAALLGGGSRRVAGRFLPAVRAQLVVLYFSAAFWKLTSSWFDPHYSCAPVLMSELLAGLQPYVHLPDELSASLLLASPAMVAGLEFCVPALLLLRPRWGVLLALVFHQTINLMPTTYAGGFSIAMCARLGALFMPGCFGAVAAWMRGAPPRGAPATARAARPLIPLFLPIGLVAITTGFMVVIHKQLDTAGAVYLAFATLYFVALTLPAAPPAAASAATAGFPAHASWALPKALVATALLTYGHYATVAAGALLLVVCAPRPSLGWAAAPRLSALACTTGAVYGYLLPVVGVMMMASSTMYGNVKNYGGGNHMLVPTGLLQDHYGAAALHMVEREMPEIRIGATTAPPAWLAPLLSEEAAAWMADGFGGGLVRVDDTNSSVLQTLYKETTDQLPPHARKLLAHIGAGGRYYEFYAARNYFDRPGDLQATAIHMGVKVEQDKLDAYVVPAYELRRALGLARAQEARFSVTYTKMPSKLRTPTEWRAYRGLAVTVVDGDGSQPASCSTRDRPARTVVGGDGGVAVGECDGASEPGMQPPPRYLLTKLLHPYPIPLIAEGGDGIFCST